MILFIASQESDYLQDLTYAGLGEVLGKDRVFDFPFHWSYHKEKRHFWSHRLQYPRNLGYVSGPSFEPVSIESLRRRLLKNGFRLVVLGSAKKDALETFIQINDSVRVPWAFIDGGDRTEIGRDFERVGGLNCFKMFQDIAKKMPPALVFKRELPLSKSEDRVFPLPFSVHASKVPILPPQSPKRYQVAFWAVESSDTRRSAFQKLKGRYDCDLNGSVAGQKFRSYSLKGGKYFEALNASKISLSFRGEGFDTLRYWEVPSCGSLLVSERPIIQIPNDFEDKKHAVFCKNDLSDLTELIDYYLGHEKEALQIAEAGQKHLLRYHTHLRRAEYLIDVLKAKAGVNLK